MSDLVALLVALPIFGSIVAFLASLVRSETGWPIAVATTAVQVLAAGVLRRGPLATNRSGTSSAGSPRRSVSNSSSTASRRRWRCSWPSSPSASSATPASPGRGPTPSTRRTCCWSPG
nr:hypothetical protein [Halapricum sp. CBA1109]